MLDNTSYFTETVSRLLTNLHANNLIKNIFYKKVTTTREGLKKLMAYCITNLVQFPVHKLPHKTNSIIYRKLQ